MKNYLAACITVLAVLASLSGNTAAAAEKAELRGAGHFVVPAWFKHTFMDLPDDVAEATRSGKRLLIYFGQDGCPYCAALFNTNFSQPHIVDYTRRHFDAIDMNIWGDREVTDFSGKRMTEKQLAEKLQVWFTPTILLVDEKGNIVLRINGYYPPHRFLAALKYAGEKQESVQTFPEYFAKLNPPPSNGVLNPEPFFSGPPYNLDQMARGKPLAVFFEQKDCAGCDRMHSDILHDPETLQLLRRFNAIQLDRWSTVPLTTPAGGKTTARDWANRLGIAYVPSVVVFDGGKEVIRVEAFLKSFHFQSVLDYVASGAYRNQPNLQRYIRARADGLRERGIIVDIWK